VNGYPCACDEPNTCVLCTPVSWGTAVWTGQGECEWPPRDLTKPAEVVAVCESVDVERKVITYRSVTPCRHVWPPQPCEVA
jgi:hypothetical protein